MQTGFAWINAAIAAQELCRERGFPFAFIGGVAVQCWGEPRVTEDVDLTLFCGFGNEAPVIQAFLSRFTPRIPDAAEFAEERRVLLLKTSEGIPIDVALCRRAVLREFLPGISLQVCQADDLVVLKAFAGRSKDWMDIENVLVRQGDRLDWDHILRELKPLVELKEAPEILVQLERLRRSVE
jgi:predicted nucleotidyltransferase